MISIFTIINGLLFVIYGFLCVFTKHMLKEFERFGLSQYRLITGILEILGGLGVLIGYFRNPYITLLSTFGLALLMLLGFWTRVRIKDPWSQAIPALILMLLNAALCYLIVKDLFFS